MQKLKVNDEVMILAGKDKGKTGAVVSINRKTSKVVVQGVNIVKKAVRATQENPNGGIIEKTNPVHVSIVSLMSPKTKKRTRVRIEDRNGKRVRVAVSCGSEL
jgi:large subunit ribosomal protein L24